MKPAIISKRIRFAKEGEIIVVPMGMNFPHAIKIDKIKTDEDGQIIGYGVAVDMKGCSKWLVGSPMSVRLG